VTLGGAISSRHFGRKYDQWKRWLSDEGTNLMIFLMKNETHYDLLFTVWLEANVFTDKHSSIF